MDRIDLHVHTTASDGTLTPSEAVAEAARLGLRAVAITDHDTQAGAAEALEAGARFGIEVVPGAELSVDWHGMGVHILGYFMDPSSGAMGPLLDWVIAGRDRRRTGRRREYERSGPVYEVIGDLPGCAGEPALGGIHALS